ncbi:MAG: dipeptide ABC transporter ATP-binding protein [Planctomycetes bacterium]|nr:dipeptide ABC transporter ATP-binding protein [Planctomycetota bacterium]MCB9913201.1 dipeptide ABC transporter ATP-binding protein [Planctomycetota bacterium]
MSQTKAAGTVSRPLLDVRGLKKYFPIRKGLFSRHVGDVKAVDGLDFTLDHGETLSLVGESGCGKTTAGRSLLRLIEPTAGEALYRARPQDDAVDLLSLSAEEMREQRKDLQIIFQDPFASLNPRITVGNTVGEALKVHGIATGRELEERVAQLLQKVGLRPDVANRFPHEFSGGQRQRVGIARALALHPRLIVCDEAVSALDVSVQAQVINLLKDLQQEFGLSYIFIAHDLSVVRYISDRVAVMYLGRIVEMGPADQIFENPQHPYTQALLSAIPRANPAYRTTRIRLEGDVPSPIRPPAGCHFHPRCRLATERCKASYPEIQRSNDGHMVRCHEVTLGE